MCCCHTVKHFITERALEVFQGFSANAKALLSASRSLEPKTIFKCLPEALAWYFLTKILRSYVTHQPENKRKPVIEHSRNAPIVWNISKVRMNHRKEYVFSLLGFKGYFLFLITKKEKIPFSFRCSLNNKNASMSALPANKAPNLQRFIKP